MDYWTPEEIKLLEENFPLKSTEELCDLLKKPRMAVLSKAQRLKLKKHWRFRQQVLKNARKVALAI